MEIVKDDVIDIEVPDIKSKLLGKKVRITGMVSKITGMLNELVKTEYICNVCGTHRKMKNSKEPFYCFKCRTNTSFTQIDEKFIDFREMELEEVYDNLERQPERIKVRLFGDILDRIDIKNIQIGQIVEVIGVVSKEKSKVKNEREIYSYYLTCSVINILEDSKKVDEITESDELKIENIKNNNPLEILSKSLAPNIIGMESIKKSIILQMARGIENLKNIRPRIHILLVGSPSSAKSQLAWEVFNKTPKSLYGSGDNMSAAGLTATIEKDEFSGKWSVDEDTLIPYLENNNLKIKKIKDLFEIKNKENIKILGFDEETKKVRWVRCEEIIRHKFFGKMVNLRQGIGEVNVTEHHSVYDKNFKVFLSEENKDMAGIRKIPKLKENKKITIKTKNISKKIKKDKKGRFVKNFDGVVIKKNYKTEREIKDLLRICAGYISKGRIINYKDNIGIEISNIKVNELNKIIDSFKRISNTKMNNVNFYGGSLEKKIMSISKNYKKCFKIKLYSIMLKEFIKENCGIYSENKKIPSFIFNLEDKYKLFFINELIKSNEHINKKIKSYISKSKELIIGIGVLYSMIGINFNINYLKVNKRRPTQVYSINIHKRKVMFKPKKEKIIKEINRLNYKTKKIKISKSKGQYVYDIVNSETNNFIGGIGNILLHNSARGGILSRANKSLVIIDEMTRLKSEDKKALHTPMESGIIIVDKAGLHITLNADCSILGCCNPKKGDFDTSGYNSISQEVNLPEPIISRFDLIFYIKDDIDEKKDKKILETFFIKKDDKPIIDTELFKKYIFRASKIEPIISDEFKETLEEIYIKLRKGSKNSLEKITSRQAGGLIRLAVASAKIRMSDVVELQDLEIAENLMLDSLESIGFERELNSLDQTSIYTNTTRKRINVQIQMVELIKDLINSGKKTEKELEETILLRGFAIDLFKRTFEGLHREGSIIKQVDGLKWVA